MNVLVKYGQYLLRSSIYYEKVLIPTFIRHYAKDNWTDVEIDLTSIEETPKYVDILTEEQRNVILKKRNKSGLLPMHRNILHNSRPYDQSIEWYHNTIRYKRSMLGRYGMKALDVPVGALWLTKEGIEDRTEYEKVANPYTIQEGWKILEEKRQKEAETIRLRDEEIEANLKKRSIWEKELEKKIAQKTELLEIAQKKKARLIEEVRRKLGFEVNPRDVKFQAALEQMEAEEKKRRKEMKKQERTARMLAMLVKQSQEVSSVMKKAAEKKDQNEAAMNIEKKEEKVEDTSSEKSESK